MNRLNKIKEDSPDLLDDPHIVEMAEQSDIVHDLKALHDTAGGKQLVKLLIEDTIGVVHRLCGGYTTMSHTELIALCAQLDSKLSTAKLLIDAKDVVKVLDEELEEALRE